MFEFLKNTRGNVAMIFALCLIPIVVLMGGALDLSRQRSGEGFSQDALDAALLAIAGGAQDKNDAQLTREAREWFQLQLQATNLIIDDFQVVKVGDELTATMSGHVDTAFLGIIGIGELEVNRTASVRIGLTKVEIVMVLDTTGSMRSTPSGQSMTKLESLQDAALDMVNNLATLDNGRGNIEIGMVPFATYVNVGAENINANWMDDGARSPVHSDNLAEGLNRFDLYEHMGFEWKGCVMARPAPHDVRDTRPRAARPATLFVPLFHPDEPDSRYRWYQEYPNNYVEDADFSLGSDLLNVGNPVKYGVPETILQFVDGISNSVLNTLVVTCDDGDDINLGSGQECNDGWAASPLNPANWDPVTINSNYQYYSDVTTQIGPGFSCEMRPILPLTSNFQTARNEINALTASGSTNIAQGVVWGWHVLSPSAPFTEGDQYSHSVQKVMIVLSDGNNIVVARPNHPGGSDFSAYGYMENDRLEGLPNNYDTYDIMDAMDDRTLLACQNAKDAGVRIFTIRLSLADDRSEELMSACASSPEDYIDVQDSDRLDDAFRRITERISQLYLSR